MQYLFNAPEGFARLVLEHKVRPSQHIRAAFLSQLQPQAAVSDLAPNVHYVHNSNDSCMASIVEARINISTSVVPMSRLFGVLVMPWSAAFLTVHSHAHQCRYDAIGKMHKS